MLFLAENMPPYFMELKRCFLLTNVLNKYKLTFILKSYSMFTNQCGAKQHLKVLKEEAYF